MIVGSLAVWAGVVLAVLIGVPAGASAGARRQRRASARKRRTLQGMIWSRHRREVQMGLMLTEVATRLRSGATVETAWERTLEHFHVGPTGAGEALFDTAGVPAALRKLWNMSWLERRKARLAAAAFDAIPATIAVCRMGHTTGAPMAEILDSCAAGVAEAGEARSARDIALAGPQASAHMLAVLPLLGLALGYVLGADPFAFLFGTIWGKIALLGGVISEVAGILLVRRMVAKAKREADFS